MTGIIEEIMTGFWMMEPRSASSYIPIAANLLKGNFNLDPNVDLSEIRLQNKPRFAVFNEETYHISEYGEYNSPEDAPKNSIAIISLHGPITYYDQYCGPSGMATKANIVDRIGANSNIKALVFEIRSGGGEGYAASKLVRSIKNLGIPTFAFVEDLAASAAYKIAAATDFIVVNTNQARVGSIGTYVTLADFTERFKMEGINLIEIYATKSKDKNKDYREALKGNTQLIQQDVDFWNEQFLNEIREDRQNQLAEDESIWGTGKLFYAEEALKNGLIDSIASFEELLIEIENQL